MRRALFPTGPALDVTSSMGIIATVGIAVSNRALGVAHIGAPAVIEGPAMSMILILVLIPTLYVMLAERFPRRIAAAEGEPVLQGDPV
jgi:multidrug efflux pump subunit AcrB